MEAVRDAHTLTTRIPHEYAVSVARIGETGFFQGKQIRSDAGASTHLRGVQSGTPMILTVEDMNGFHAGDRFTYEDVQPGDTFTIEAELTLAQTGSNRYRLRGDMDCAFSAPHGITVDAEPRIRVISDAK